MSVEENNILHGMLQKLNSLWSWCLICNLEIGVTAHLVDFFTDISVYCVKHTSCLNANSWLLIFKNGDYANYK